MEKIFVAGAGLMGSGIAQTALQCGFTVTLYDINKDLVEKGKNRIEGMLGKNVTKGRMAGSDMQGALNRLTLCDSLGKAEDADIVIEAVVENAAVKKEMFGRLSGICSRETILATNTSSIPITEIAAAVSHPGRFVGMHFFSPVPLMKLLEIARGLATTKKTVEAAMDLGRRMGKACIVSKDSPAFIVNRLLDPMINEAIGLLEAGIGSIEDIDSGMKYGCNHPMGLLELIDMAGIDIELAVMEVLYSETGDSKYRPSTLLKNMVRAGYLGRKAGKGFYVYPENGGKYPNPDLI